MYLNIGDLSEHLVVGHAHESRHMVLPDVDDVDGPPESSAVDRGLLAKVDKLHATHL
jgi:hypothetical protein